MSIINPIQHRDQLRAYWAAITDSDIACQILNTCSEGNGYFVVSCHFARIEEFKSALPDYDVVFILQTTHDCKDNGHGMPESVTIVFKKRD